MSMFPALQYTREGELYISNSDYFGMYMEPLLVSSRYWGGALRDDTKNGYLAD